MRTDLIGRGIAYYMMHDKRLEIELNNGDVFEGIISEHVNGNEEPWLAMNHVRRIDLKDIKTWREVGPLMNEQSAQISLPYVRGGKAFLKRLEKVKNPR